MSTQDHSTTVWRLMTHHKYPEEALQWAIEHERLAIGWGRIGDIKVEGYASPTTVFAAIKKFYPERRDNVSHGRSLYHFCYQMKVGDLVILKADGNYAGVMEVTSEYEYKQLSEATSIGDYQHQRKAKILAIDAKALWTCAGEKAVEGSNIRVPLIQCIKPIDMTTKEALSSVEKGKYIACPADVYISADEVDEDTVYQEGAVRQVTVNAYERNPQARRKCIAHYGARCMACKLDFGARYGKAGADFIHVHHLRPLSDISTQYAVNPVEDLRPVCPNCHAVIHRRNPPYSIEEVQEMLREHSE